TDASWRSVGVLFGFHRLVGVIAAVARFGEGLGRDGEVGLGLHQLVDLGLHPLVGVVEVEVVGDERPLVADVPVVLETHGTAHGVEGYKSDRGRRSPPDRSTVSDPSAPGFVGGTTSDSSDGGAAVWTPPGGPVGT